MVGKEWSREVIKIWCEFLDGKISSSVENGGIWNDDPWMKKGDLVGENSLERLGKT